MNEASGVYKFAGVGELAETVTQLLALGLQYETELGRTPGRRSKSGLEKIEQLILQQARDYLAEVREGFVLSVRTSQLGQHGELQFLLDRVLVDWGALSSELGLATDGNAAESNGPTGQRAMSNKCGNNYWPLAWLPLPWGISPSWLPIKLLFPTPIVDPGVNKVPYFYHDVHE